MAYHSEPSVAGSSFVTCRAGAWPDSAVRGGSAETRYSLPFGPVPTTSAPRSSNAASNGVSRPDRHSRSHNPSAVMRYTAPLSPAAVAGAVADGVVAGVAAPPTTTAVTLVVTETVGTGAAAGAGAGAGAAAGARAGWPLTATASSEPSGCGRSERTSS